MAVHLGLLALEARSSPGSNIGVHTWPDEVTCHHSLGGSNSWVRKRVKAVKDLPAETLRHVRTGNSSRYITHNQSSIRKRKRKALELKGGVRAQFIQDRITLLCCCHCSEVHRWEGVVCVSSIDHDTGEGISSRVVRSFHVADVAGELRDQVKMSNLPWCVLVGIDELDHQTSDGTNIGCWKREGQSGSVTGSVVGSCGGVVW